LKVLPPGTRISGVILALLVGALTATPIIMLLIGSFSKGLTATGAFTLEKYIKAYSNPALPRILLNTLIFVLGSAAFASLLAFTLAYLNVRTDIPFKGLFNVIPVIPMMVPHILFAVSWMLLLNPSNGIVNLSIRTLFHTRGSLFNIYTLPGMIFVEGLLDLPIAYLIIAPAMASFDPSLEEASRISGASGWRTLRRITLPVLKPALLASFTLVLVRSLAAFAVPTMIGMPGRVYVLSTHIYRLISTGYATDYGEAAAVGVIVLATSITFIFVYRKLTSETEKYVTVSGKGYRPAVIGLGKYKYPILGIVGILLLFMIVLPVLTLLYTSLLPYSMVPSARAFSMMNLGVLLSALIAYTVVRVKSVTSAILETSVFLSFSFPGLVIGVGFMWFFVRTPLYATLAALLIGYIATYLPYGVRPLTSAFVQIHKDLEDSSRIRLRLDPNGHYVSP